MNMKIQEQIINEETGSSYWKIHFEIVNQRELTLSEWEVIKKSIDKIIDNFNMVDDGE